MILVTGANGFLGSYICRELLRKNLPVRAVIREDSRTDRISDILDRLDICYSDLLDLPMLDSCFSNAEKVIHCGAQISFQQHDCDSLIQTNIETTRNVVNLCMKHNVGKLVHISSTAAIGRTGAEDIVDENTSWAESRYTSCYGKSKYLSELEVWRGQSEGLNVTVLNPSIILGRKTLGESSGQLLRYAMEPHRFFPTGDLNFVDVRDVARIAVQVTEHEYSSRKFIVNAGKVPYRDFFSKVAEIIGISEPSVAAEGWKLSLALYGDMLRSVFTGKQRILSREMIRSSSARPTFSNKRVTSELNYSFIPLNDSLQWIFSDKEPLEKK